jgi:excisionase family DNA binding protein
MPCQYCGAANTIEHSHVVSDFLLSPFVIRLAPQPRLIVPQLEEVVSKLADLQGRVGRIEDLAECALSPVVGLLSRIADAVAPQHEQNREAARAVSETKDSDSAGDRGVATDREYLTVREVSEVFFEGKVSRRAVHDLFAQGKLKGFRVGGKILIYRSSLDEYRLSTENHALFWMRPRHLSRGRQSSPGLLAPADARRRASTSSRPPPGFGQD